ncbi:hypothetical protein [Mucilaginibacter agri]|uniref:O-antigen ligase domain-containing protein n=1 Tax=Mucilaginibacter agri TaxID=2695265 RepID=A0A965ZB64_9SPHI|nr:hypothetical protein [Mucilaginibacter agri]NCD67819.1 hypothetical protein [Mucilaginibacter agri]
MLKSNKAKSVMLHSKDNALKNGIWLFFWLLIFEGALRKWVLPGLATPLLLIRDPLALWIVFKAWHRGLVPFNIYTFGAVAVGVISIFTAVLFGHGSFLVAIYGSRVWFLYFPLIFVIGSVFTKDDVMKFAQKYLILSIPMTLLIVIQFYSPQSAWVNRGIGGNEGAGFSGAMDFFRPPGTFSFASGVGGFYSALACFVFYYWLDPKSINKKLLIASTICLIIAVPISIIRGLFFEVMITLAFMLVSAFRKPQNAGRMVAAIAVGCFLILILSQLSFFQTAIEAFTMRFTTANDSEGGLGGVVGNRYFGTMIYAFTMTASQPFWGYGSGIGTNVGAVIATGKADFYSVVNGEVEWQRVIGELGILLGIIIIGIRIGLSFKLLKESYQLLTREYSLPWMILPFCLMNLPQGQLGSPIPLGFTTWMAGMLLASCNSKKRKIVNS